MMKHVGKDCKMAVLLVSKKAQNTPLQKATSWYLLKTQIGGKDVKSQGERYSKIRGIVRFRVPCQELSRLYNKAG
jgi:hypothetical protein